MARDGKSKVPLKGTMLPSFLKDIRKSYSLKAEFVASKINIVASSYSDYENGNTGKILVDKLEKILDAVYKEFVKQEKKRIKDEINELKGQEVKEEEEVKEKQWEQMEQDLIDKIEDFDSFVCRLLKEKFLDIINPQALRNQFWVYVIFFKHTYVTEVSVLGNKNYMYGLLQRLYNCNDWKDFFRKLNDSGKLLKNSECQEKNKVYIYPPANSSDPPIIRVRYNLTEKQIDEKVEDLNNLRLKTIDIFTLVFNGYLLNGDKINVALRKTCKKFGEWNFRLIYNLLQYYDLPQYGKYTDFSKDSALLSELTSVMDRHNITYNDMVNMFRENYLECKTKFITAIAFDFSFINRLNSVQLNNYREELIKTTDEYKKSIWGETISNKKE